MTILPTDIQIISTNYDIIAYLLKPGFLFRTYTVGTVPEFNRKIVEMCKFDIPEYK
jgi:hypothetical protein